MFTTLYIDAPLQAPGSSVSRSLTGTAAGRARVAVPSDSVSEGSRAKPGLVSEAADPPHLVLFLPVFPFFPLDNQIPIYFSQKIWEGQKKTKEQNTATQICLPKRPPPSSKAC